VKPLSAALAARLLRQMRGQRVLVAGDLMLDEFLWGRVSRISPEAPVPVVQVSRQSFHLGGAGNVASSVRALGGQAVVVGVVGRDPAAVHVREALNAAGVEEALVVAGGGRPTTVKTRIVAHHQQVVRADRESDDDVPPDTSDELLERIRAALPTCGALVVSDYQKGVVTPRLMKALLPMARRRGVPVLVDPKVRHFALYRKVAVVTPNQLEAEQATGRPIRSVEDLRAAGARILRLLGCDAVLVTRGELGMALFPRQGRAALIPTAAREVFDVTGAGDTVIATLALGLAAGAPLAQAAVLANHAAGVVVGKVGTATATPDEVLAALQRPPG
jgi:D-beta-D-heptose 7-phosphate kinase/D-beta-D-heptose 1-phosphate adenosyltransferase